MACPFSAFCLGMCEWTDCPGFKAKTTPPNETLPTNTPPTTDTMAAAPLSSSSLPNGTSKRFSTFVDDEQLAVLSKGVVPANTDKSTKWALANFEAWRRARNEKYPANPVPEDLLTTNDPALLNTQLSRFVLETRKSNGEFYPPKTLHQLLCGLLRHMRDINPGCPNFLDKKDATFNSLHGTMDAHFHNLHSGGVGRDVKHARVLTKDDEDKLWRSGVMGTITPKALQNAVFTQLAKCSVFVVVPK